MSTAALQHEALPASCARACSGCVVREQGICQALETPHLATLQGASRWRTLTAGEAFCREGDPVDRVASVKSGVLRLSRLLPDGRRHITGFAFPGDFIGLTLETLHGHTAEALGEAMLCLMPRRQFETMRHDFPELDSQLYTRAAQELVAAREQMLSLGRKSAVEKVATFLLEMSERTQQMPLGPCRAFLPMTRTDMADYLGLRLETVSRVFSTLRGAGLITLVTASEVLIHLPEVLRDYADGV